MFMEERHREILKILERNRRISVGEIEDRFGVSVDSARRDLRILERKGLLQRTHGGAIQAIKVNTRPPEKYDPREMPQILDNYAAIAKHAAGMILENDTVYITSGSVGFLMTKYLKDAPPFTLVTNSIILADELKACDQITIYLSGGRMRQKGTFVDSFATAFVKNMHFDKSFMTGAGFSAAFGLSNGTHETAVFQKTVLENSRMNVALMPSQKIGFNSFIKVTDASAFDTLVTDWEAFEEELGRIREVGVEVVAVKNPNPQPKLEIIV